MTDEFGEWIKKMLMFTAFQLIVLAGAYAVYRAWREISHEKG